jgi:hypothetical protein
VRARGGGEGELLKSLARDINSVIMIYERARLYARTSVIISKAKISERFSKLPSTFPKHTYVSAGGHSMEK